MKKYFFISLLILSFFSVNGQTIITIAGNGTPGYSGDGGPATVAQLKYVGGLAIDTSGNVFIGDQNHVIRRVDPSGFITTFAGNDTFGFSGDSGPATAAKMAEANAIATDKKGNVYFCDLGNSRVRKVDRFGIITTFAGNGSGVISGNGGAATAAGLGAVGGVCVDDTGNVYIHVQSEIRKVDLGGIITSFAGTGVPGFSGDGGMADTAKLSGSNQIEFDTSGNLYLCDNQRIRKINRAGIIMTVAGNGLQGFSGDGFPATAAEFNTPTGLFPDKCGNIYIADFYNNRIRMVNDIGIITTVVGNGYGGVGGGSIGSWTGGGTGDRGPATAAELYGPWKVYLDKQGSIYFTDEYNHEVRYVHMDSCITVKAGALASPRPSPPVERVTLWPNPVTDELNIGGVTQSVSYNLYNITGSGVLKGTLQKGSNSLYVGYLAPGIYVLEMVGEDGDRKRVRVVKE
jgi:type IX secretion system substrate protein